MRRQIVVTSVIAGQIIAVVLLVGAPAAACMTTDERLGTALHDQAPPSFTFIVDVAMRMRSFPWLGFHMEGLGKYEPGKSYTVHFDKLPWFSPRKEHDADLSMLDPSMWPTRFTYQQAGEENGNTLFDLRALEDPTLTSAEVGVGPKGCARQVKAAYNDGTQIQMNVKFSPVDGFMLPASLTANIKVPLASFSANGEFKNYSFALGSAR